MPRLREKVKMTQPSITEYFTVRKPRKRTANNLQSKEKSLSSPTVKRIVASDSRHISKKKNKVSRSSSLSRLLISVLDKNFKLQSLSTRSHKENNNPNVKNTSESQNINSNFFKKESFDRMYVEENAETSKEGRISVVSPSIKNNAKEVVQKKAIQAKNSRNSLLEINPSPKNIPLESIKGVNCDNQEEKNSEECFLPAIEKYQRICKKYERANCTIPSQTEKLKPDDDSTRLPLPNDYDFLAKVFICIDRVAAMLYNQNRIITFEKLKPALQNMAPREVTLDHLAQIKTIYPEAYTYENQRNFFVGLRKPQYDLVLIPKFESSTTTNKSDSQLFTGSVLSTRSKRFYNVLLDRVKDEHEQFLSENSKSKPIIPKEEIKSWNPRFRIEKCKPIEKSTLPIIQKHSSKEVLEKIIECSKNDTNLETSVRSQKIDSKTVKTKYDNKRAGCYHKLYDIAKIMNRIFRSEKKKVLPLNLVVKKLQYSCESNLTTDEMEKYVRFLCEVVPYWIRVFDQGRADRLKIDKEIPFVKVLKILEALAKDRIKDSI